MAAKPWPAGACTHSAGNAGTVCRAKAGFCDVAETCNGTSTTCPADGFVVNGTSCDDGNSCTSNDVCTNGLCAGAGVQCLTPPACHTATGATCSLPSGTCVYPAVTDGTSNTILVTEADDAVAWTKPDAELKFDPKAKPSFNGAGSLHPGGFNALFGDGSVRFIKMAVNAQVFFALITRAGGEVVAADAY